MSTGGERSRLYTRAEDKFCRGVVCFSVRTFGLACDIMLRCFLQSWGDVSTLTVLQGHALRSWRLDAKGPVQAPRAQPGGPEALAAAEGQDAAGELPGPLVEGPPAGESGAKVY